ncbi:hypothetical protein B5P22_24605 [Pseudomonas tolaasii]|nr:hypothetical protein B5P22_24605 [Pseudomonas tolaasii]
MTRTELLNKLSRVTLIGEGRIVIKRLDYTSNPLAPQAEAWAVMYSEPSGVRRKAVYHGERYGWQWSY